MVVGCTARPCGGGAALARERCGRKPPLLGASRPIPRPHSETKALGIQLCGSHFREGWLEAVRRCLPVILQTTPRSAKPNPRAGWGESVVEMVAGELRQASRPRADSPPQCAGHEALPPCLQRRCNLATACRQIGWSRNSATTCRRSDPELAS